jgi:uncharacterized membrane protein
VLFGFVGVAVDMASLNQSKAQLQSVADSAALAAAREMRLGNAAQVTIDQVARNYVNSIIYSTTKLKSVETSTSIPADFKNVTVTLVAPTSSLFATKIGIASSSISVSARASVKGGAPLCMVMGTVRNFVCGAGLTITL